MSPSDYCTEGKLLPYLETPMHQMPHRRCLVLCEVFGVRHAALGKRFAVQFQSPQLKATTHRSSDARPRSLPSCVHGHGSQPEQVTMETPGAEEDGITENLREQKSEDVNFQMNTCSPARGTAGAAKTDVAGTSQAARQHLSRPLQSRLGRHPSPPGLALPPCPRQV